LTTISKRLLLVTGLTWSNFRKIGRLYKKLGVCDNNALMCTPINSIAYNHPLQEPMQPRLFKHKWFHKCSHKALIACKMNMMTD